MARVAVVTGGTRGIGRAISVALKNAGYKVAANYGGHASAAQQFHRETGIPVFKFDVADFKACAEGVKKIEGELGPIEVLVNNAGITRDSTMHRMSYEHWNAVIQTNLSSCFNMSRAVIEACGREASAASSISVRSTGRRGNTGRSTTPRRSRGFTALPRRWRKRARGAASPSMPWPPA